MQMKRTSSKTKQVCNTSPKQQLDALLVHGLSMTPGGTSESEKLNDLFSSSSESDREGLSRRRSSSSDISSEDSDAADAFWHKHHYASTFFFEPWLDGTDEAHEHTHTHTTGLSHTNFE